MTGPYMLYNSTCVLNVRSASQIQFTGSQCRINLADEVFNMGMHDCYIYNVEADITWFFCTNLGNQTRLQSRRLFRS